MKGASIGRLLVLGGLWGVAMTAMESFDAQVDLMNADQVQSFLILISGHYIATAMALSFGCAWLEPRLNAWQLALALVVFAALESAAHTGLLVFAYHVGVAAGLQALFVRPRSMLTSFLYDFWPVCFYGGLFVIAMTFNARAERRRALLGQVQVAADYADTDADQARAAALNAGLQPSFLLEATMRLQQLYEVDPVAAGQLMTELVAFLRAASISDRTAVSTLAEELALVESYARVRLRLGQPDTLSLTIDGLAPDGRFPGALLLPVIDRLLSLGETRVVLRGDATGATLSLGGAPGGASFCADTEAHIRRALSLSGGHPVTRRDEAAQSWLDIHLVAGEAAPSSRPFPAFLQNLPLANLPEEGAFHVQRAH